MIFTYGVDSTEANVRIILKKYGSKNVAFSQRSLGVSDVKNNKNYPMTQNTPREVNGFTYIFTSEPKRAFTCFL